MDFDTTCTYHMAHNRELFHNYNQFPTPIAVCDIGSRQHLTYARGTLHIGSLHNGQASNRHRLEYVWYVLKMDVNIILKSWTKRYQLKVKMNENEDHLITNDKGMCLHTHNIAGQRYIKNPFTQPFLSSYTIVHAGSASEHQSMGKL
jgi:Pol polyprotein, beta-barrel domain